MTTVSVEDLPALAATVVASSFALAFVFGAVAQRTGFCTMGAVADVVNFGDWTRMRQWLLAIAVAVLATNGMAAAGVIDLSDAFYTTPRFTPLAYVVGGLLFGFGMVLAGGCGSRTVVRAGGGSLKSLVVFLVLGLSAYISLRGAFAVVRVYGIEPVGVELPTHQDLPSLLAAATGVARPTLQWALGLLVGGALLAFALARRDFLHFDNLLAGIAVGGVIAGVWFVSGYVGRLDEHPVTIEEAFVATNSGRMESLSFVAPVAYTLDWLMFFSDRSKVITLGVAGVLGTFAGSAAYALASGRFRFEGFSDTEDTANHLVGATLMGFGGVTALGCTIGQGLSGVSTLAIGSLLAFASIVAGAVAGVKYQAWRIERSG
ncbi:YeeE/YedE family protein [Betaproteobacteria bacterium PRO7]|nr:YeeE/YedE family protein [Betaproteobacteria bacterium PRO7]